MRVVIELKKDANPQVVLNNLFKQTALQSSFGIIMLALVDNQKQPKILLPAADHRRISQASGRGSHPAHPV